MIVGPIGLFHDEPGPIKKKSKNPDEVFVIMAKEIVDKYDRKAVEKPPQVIASQYFYSILNELKLASWGAYGRDITGNLEQESAEKIKHVLENKFPQKDTGIEFEVARTTSDPPTFYRIMVKGSGMLNSALMELVTTAASAMAEMASI